MRKALKLHKGHLTVGKPLLWDVYDSLDQLLLSRSYIIESESQLESLLSRGMYVDAAELEASIEKNHLVKHFDPFWLWDDLLAKLGYQLTHPNNELEFTQRIVEIAGQTHVLVQKHADTVLAIILLAMDHRRYSIVHSLQTAILCDMVANRLGWEKQRIMNLLCAALTMNIAMLELQQQLTNQRTPLTPEQDKLVKEHPLHGSEILRHAGVDSQTWLDSVKCHHETASGTGYPDGITEVIDEAALLRTIDVFCAKISPRMHRKPMSGTQAERVLFSEAGMASENPFIPTLIKEIGVYPPGTFVKLANGETAVVLKRSQNIATPHVLSLINSKGDPLIEPIRRDTSRDGLKITGDVPRESILINVNPARIWNDSATG